MDIRTASRWVLATLTVTGVSAGMVGCSSASSDAEAACRAELESLVGAATVEFSGNPTSAGVDTWELRGYWDATDEITAASEHFTCVANDMKATIATDTTTDAPPALLAEPDPGSTVVPCNFVTGEGCEDREPTQTTAGPAEGCVIKGNVSFDTGELIYHVPGQAYYAETDIDESYGERWFCTEQDAIDAGWRKSEV